MAISIFKTFWVDFPTFPRWDIPNHILWGHLHSWKGLRSCQKGIPGKVGWMTLRNHPGVSARLKPYQLMSGFCPFCVRERHSTNKQLPSVKLRIASENETIVSFSWPGFLLISGPTLWGAQPPQFSNCKSVCCRLKIPWGEGIALQIFDQLSGCPKKMPDLGCCPWWCQYVAVWIYSKDEFVDPKFFSWRSGSLIILMDCFDSWTFFMYLYNCTSLYFHMHPVFFWYLLILCR